MAFRNASWRRGVEEGRRPASSGRGNVSCGVGGASCGGEAKRNWRYLRTKKEEDRGGRGKAASTWEGCKPKSWNRGATRAPSPASVDRSSAELRICARENNNINVVNEEVATSWAADPASGARVGPSPDQNKAYAISR